MSSYKNQSAWSHCGDAHKGVYLKFKTGVIPDRQSINLHGIIGEGAAWPRRSQVTAREITSSIRLTTQRAIQK